MNRYFWLSTALLLRIFLYYTEGVVKQSIRWRFPRTDESIQTGSQKKQEIVSLETTPLDIMDKLEKYKTIHSPSSCSFVIKKLRICLFF